MQNTNLNTSPYYDDFDVNKNFYKVLFRPGYPVQARELTTSQSILQHQIENFGKSVYKDGSVVIPGQITYDNNYYAVKVNSTFAGFPVETYRNSLIGLTIRGAKSNVTATIINTLSATDLQNTSGYITLYVKYISSSTSNNSTVAFFDDEDLISSSNIVAGTTTILNTQGFAHTIAQNSTSIGSSASIESGVYYIRGYFVDVPKQTIILDPYTNTPSYKVGLQVIENIVTPEQDSTLYDNAIGTSNYSAPGAHRFQIVTSLIKKELTDPDNTNFIELLRVKNGAIQKSVDRSAFSEIQKEIARRTYDTNGDYYVKPFDIIVRENLSNGLNNGVYKANQTTEQGNTPSADKLAIQISPGSAFVRGYEIQTISSTYIDVNKPRQTNTLLSQSSPNTLGNYVEVGVGTSDAVGMFNFSSGPAVVSLYNDYCTSISVGSGVTIGYARVINVEQDISTIPSNGAVYQIFLTDIEFFGGTGSTYTFSNVKSLQQSGYAYANLRTVLNDRTILSGTNSLPIIGAGSTATLSGYISNYTSELQVGDILTAGSGTSGLVQKFRINSISSGSSASITNISSSSSVAGSYTFTINRPRLENGAFNKLYSILPKTSVKTVKVNSLQVRQQKTFNIISNTITINLDQGSVFSSTNPSDFVGFDSNQSPLNIVSITFNPTFTTATINTSGNTGATATVSYSITKNNSTERVKTPKLMSVIEVNKTVSTGSTLGTGLISDTTNIGARIEDTIISLGVPDAFKLHAVYESTSSNAATIPNFSSTVTGFVKGEIIYGNSSGSLGRVVSADGSNVYFVYLSNTPFTNGENVTGYTSGSISSVISLDNGSPNRVSDYILDNGQRDQIYDFARIIRTVGTPTPARKLKIVFDYFEQSSSGDYFTANSYTGISYDQIPVYKKQALSDVVDYRLSVKKPVSGVSGSGTVSSPFVVNTTTLDFISRTNSGILYFNPFKSNYLSNNFDLNYYLPRIDKLFLTSSGEFKVVNGTPSDNPTPPSDIDNAMLLARIDYSPYLFNTNGAIVTIYENKRYTMKDIGDLENRIKNVEYYTQLNLLEIDTNRMIITDANGLNRFKNGFLVDNFTDHSKGDVSNQDYECSIDSIKGGLRPSHYTTNVPLEYNQTSSSNVLKTGSLITLPYNSISSVSQPFASSSEKVNPFGITKWIGKVDLFPSSDIWMDVNISPIPTTLNQSNINSPDIFKIYNPQQNGFSPSEWCSWQTSWSGVDIISSGSVYTNQSNNYVTSINNQWNTAFGILQGANQRETFSTQPSQSRNQIRTNITPTSNTKIIENRRITRSYLSYIRSRNVSFTANRLKPKTQFYTFFDGIDVSTYITPKLIEINMISGTFNIGETIVGQTSGCKLLSVPPNDGFDTNPYSSTDSVFSSVYSNTSNVLNHDIFALSSQINGNYFGNVVVGERLVGQQSGAVAVVSNKRLISDKNGLVSGSFFIPDPSIQSNPKFNVGNRNFRLTSNKTNYILSDTSIAEFNFSVAGILEKQETNLESLSRNIDPIAETFFVNSVGGEFITGVDLYFKTADTNNIPVSVQIVTVEAGIPTKKVVPFADSTVFASNVSTSSDASVPTRFTFKSPVYLEENKEYALVIISDSIEYSVWVAKVNETDIISGTNISNQPYTGVFFKSQNSSTWIPDQLTDLKFTLYRAQFTSNTGTLLLNNSDLSQGNRQILNLPNNPLQLIGGGTTITVIHPNHGMHGSGNSVTISGVISEIRPTTLTSNIGTTPVGTGFSTITVVDASNFHQFIGGTGNTVSASNPGYIKIDNEIFSYSGINSNTINILGRAQAGTIASGHTSGSKVECYNLNGIPLTQINTTTQVINPSLDTYQIFVTSPANSNLNGGGNSVFATQNVQYETFLPQVDFTLLPKTSITSRYKGVSGTSVDGSETSYIFDSGFSPVSLNSNNYTSYPKLIASIPNQLVKLNNQKSFSLELNFNNNGIDNLSPVINLDRVGLIATTNRIRGNINSISTGSTLSVGDQSTAIYVTKLIRLDKSATSLKVMFSAWRPSASVIDVYYKLLPLNSQANIDSVPYTQFSTSTSLSSIPGTSEIEIYRDYEFNSNNLNFGAFAIKIVMRSSNQALVPVIKDLRIIALT